jgi:hypothetical protein
MDTRASAGFILPQALGTMESICHAAATTAAILSLTVAVIQPCLPALLIASVGLSQLFPPALLFCRVVLTYQRAFARLRR